ncbi:TPA: hypothetical protein ACMY33_001286 [Yersinia enterocolitica]|nr:hypothetical protein [Yersinia enterocolitica]
MTEEIKTGGPAFPQSGAISGAGDIWMSSELGGSGLTIRDYFAAKYMQGVSANPDRLYSDNDLAKEAYQMADAMLAARSK